MDIFKGFIFIFMMFLLPILIGSPLLKKVKADREVLALSYVTGLLIMFSLFYMIDISCMLVHLSFTPVCVIWGILTGFLVLFGSLYCGKKLLKKTKDILGRLNGPIILLVLLILLQIYFACFYQHSDGDDAQYVTMATTVAETNRLSGISPSTGEEISFNLEKQYYLAPFPYFWAMWGRFLNLHPAIIMHTFLPAVIIVFAYIVYYLIAVQLFKNSQKELLFLYFMCLWNIFGNVSSRMASSYLLLRPWQGKAVLTAILIPLLMYLSVRIREAENNIFEWILMLTGCIASCLLSGMSLILIPLLVVIFAGYDFWKNKKIQLSLKYVSCMAPYFLVFLIYYFYNG